MRFVDSANIAESIRKPLGRRPENGPQTGLRRPQLSVQHLVLGLATVLLLYLLFGPLIVLFLSSIKITPGSLPLDPGPIGLANFARVYSDPRTYSLLMNSLFFTVGSVAIGISTATALAWLVERTNMPFRTLVYTLILIPMVIPGMLMALSWILLLDARSGVVNLWVRGLLNIDGEGPFNIYTVEGMFFVEGLRIVPTAFLMIAAAFRNMDPALEEQARAGGASAFTTLRRVTLPLLAPALLGATIYFTILVIQAFEIPGVIGLTAGLHLLSTRIYWAISPAEGIPDYGYASSLAILLLVLAMGLILVYSLLTRSASRFTTVTGRGFKPTRVDLGAWRYVGVGFAGLFFLFSAALPLLILVWTSMLPLFFVPPSLSNLSILTFDTYIETLRRPGLARALGNTIAVVLITATTTMAFVTITSWFICRTRMAGRGILDAMTFAPLAIPSVVLALGVAYVYLSFPNPIYGTIWILIIAMTTNYIAFGSRTMNGAFVQIHSELEEAARVGGAGWLEMLRRVTVPLLSPAFVNGWVWVAIHAMRDLTVPLMLFTPSSIVIATVIWNMWLNADLPKAAALGVILVILTVFISAAGSILGRRRMLLEGAK